MVHSFKPLRRLGLGVLSAKVAQRLKATVELGYLCGSLLFGVGTLYFFPVEGLEDFRLGCRFYEIGSVLFLGLTLYTELDHYKAKKRGDQGRDVKNRELLEQLLYVFGSLVFFVGTLLYDPPVVDFLAWVFASRRGRIVNTAAVFFMLGSFLFSLGSYVNALSIFEAPRMLRKHQIRVTTCYQFGGLFFIAGTMGYVDAFEPNYLLKLCATWLYMAGCCFYITGSGLSFVAVVARRQKRWERKVAELDRRRLHGAAPVGRPALDLRDEAQFHEPTVLAEVSEPDVDEEEDVELDLEVAKQRIQKHLAEVLGPEAAQDLASKLNDRDGPLGEEEDLFSAFWRSIWQTPVSPPGQNGSGTNRGANFSTGPQAGTPQAGRTQTNASASLVDNRI